MPFERTKNLPVTDAMLAQIAAVSGVAVSADDIVVFEAVAANTRPVKKPGSLFDGARVAKSVLDEMAAALNSGTQTVPLHTLHLAGSEIPVGKLFEAEVVSAIDGNYELRTMFFLPKSEVGLIEKINMGVLDEVSVGLLTKQNLCSACGFDYTGPEASSMALWDRVCPEGHMLGADGNHLVLAGLDLWSELSLVSRGAMQQAKIAGRKTISTPNQERLAASGIAPGALFLNASPQDLKESPVPDPVDLNPILEALAALQASVAAMTPPAAPAAPEADPVEAKFAALEAQIAELTALVEKPKAADLTALPVGGLAASIIADVPKAAPAATGAFKSNRK